MKLGAASRRLVAARKLSSVRFEEQTEPADAEMAAEFPQSRRLIMGLYGNLNIMIISRGFFLSTTKYEVGEGIPKAHLVITDIEYGPDYLEIESTLVRWGGVGGREGGN